MKIQSYENKSNILTRTSKISLNLDYHHIKKIVKENNDVKLFYYN
jgi:hypothetical protein